MERQHLMNLIRHSIMSKDALNKGLSGGAKRRLYKPKTSMHRKPKMVLRHKPKRVTYRKPKMIRHYKPEMMVQEHVYEPVYESMHEPSHEQMHEPMHESMHEPMHERSLIDDLSDIYKNAKSFFGFGIRRKKSKAGMTMKKKKPQSAWVSFVKKYAIKHGLSYKDAMKMAGPEYRRLHH